MPRCAAVCPQSIIGRHALDYLPAEVAEAFLQENAQVYREQRAIEFKHTYVRPETVSHWLTLKFLIPQPVSPSLIGCVSLDVTKEEQAEMALTKAKPICVPCSIRRRLSMSA